MRTFLTWLLPATTLVSSGFAEDVDFNRDVRPILADKCYACHGPDEGQRQGGDEATGGLRFDTRAGAFADLGDAKAITPGDPAASELVSRITAEDPDAQMPPADHPKQLTESEKQTLIEWIRQGADWDEHWAWTVPQQSRAPRVSGMAADANLIDLFIRDRLRTEGVAPSPRADRRTALRRLYADLIGLPPTPEEVQVFMSDTAPGAWERLVDRLLESPHYGERMAIYWLDLVRYADTVGYHGDQDISVSPYRDYVIAAFNANMPFDRFTREQLGGDLLPRPTRDQLVASGYNRLGMMSAEGGVQPKEYLAKYAADRVRTASAVWLGVTLGCAECHDHKFDPFTTKDFYRFASFFGDIKERGLYSGANADGNWGPKVEVPDASLPERLAPIDAEIASLQRILETPTPELEAAQRAWERQLADAPKTVWTPLKPDSVTATGRVKLGVQPDHSILASGPSPGTATYTISAATTLSGITGFRLEVLPHKSLPKNGPGRAGNGNFVVTEFRVATRAEPNAEPLNVPLQNASATIEQAAGKENPHGKWSAASAIDGDKKGETWGWAVLPKTGQPNALVVEATQPVGTGDGTSLTFVIDQKHTNPRHTLGHFRLSATTSPQPLKADTDPTLPEPVRAILAVTSGERTREQAQTLAAHYRSIAPLLAKQRARIEALTKQKETVRKSLTRTSLITVAVEPRPMRVLRRGNWMDDSGEIVTPGVPQFLHQIDGEDRATRLDLADWLTHESNPLTARVFVNRLWKLYFGAGLSKVLDDFGAQGEPPTHPELLDTLAVEFIASEWDVKQMVKLIVTSETYRQSSLPRPELDDRDPYNRLLARQSRFRLDAELVRDNALAVSGLLVRTIGGRSVKPYQPPGLYRHLNFPARKYKQDNGDNQYRRGLYTHWQRQFLHPAMKAFDAPPREECTAERPRSNTPLAALVLLNDPSYVEAARVFAQRAIRSGGDDDEARIHWMLQAALSRTAAPEEVAILTRLKTAHQKTFSQNPAAAQQLIGTGLAPVPDDIDPAQLAAWTSVARTVFNLHEFITRN